MQHCLAFCHNFFRLMLCIFYFVCIGAAIERSIGTNTVNLNKNYTKANTILIYFAYFALFYPFFC